MAKTNLLQLVYQCARELWTRMTNGSNLRCTGHRIIRLQLIQTQVTRTTPCRWLSGSNRYAIHRKSQTREHRIVVFVQNGARINNHARVMYFINTTDSQDELRKSRDFYSRFVRSNFCGRFALCIQRLQSQHSTLLVSLSGCVHEKPRSSSATWQGRLGT